MKAESKPASITNSFSLLTTSCSIFKWCDGLIVVTSVSSLPLFYACMWTYNCINYCSLYVLVCSFLTFIVMWPSCNTEKISTSAEALSELKNLWGRLTGTALSPQWKLLPVPVQPHGYGENPTCIPWTLTNPCVFIPCWHWGERGQCMCGTWKAEDLVPIVLPESKHPFMAFEYIKSTHNFWRTAWL